MVGRGKVNETKYRALGLSLVLASCAGDPSERDSVTTGPGLTQGSITDPSGSSSASETGELTTTTAESTSSATDPDTTAEETGESKFDVGSGSDLMGTTDGTREGCHKVDLLFVVDNSGSMAEEQSKVIANFPTFSNQVQTQLADVESYQLAVVSTDSYDTGSSDLNVNSDNPACQVIGAAITRSDAGTCTPYAEGHRFMTDMDDLDTKFACAADLGTGGSGEEKVGDAIVHALDAAMVGPAGCNDGFLRDDALLVIVVLTDEDDAEHSAGGPIDWYNAVVAAKGGQADNVVVLSLVWDDSNGNPYNCTSNGLPPLIPGDQEYGETIVEFTNMFTNGSVGNICADDYGPFFADAISVIDSACDGFTPPG